MSPQCSIKKKQARKRTQHEKRDISKSKVEAKFKTWLQLRELKNEHMDRELEISTETKLKFRFILFLSMMCFSSYALYFNITRECVEGRARLCAKACSEYVNFLFEYVIIESYPFSFLSSLWTLPNINCDRNL